MKIALRRRMRAVLSAIDADSRRRASIAVVAPLLDFVSSGPLGAGPVALFASMGDELDTTPFDDALWMRGIVRVFPQVVGEELVFRALPASVRLSELPRAAFGAPSPTVDFVRCPLSRCAAVVVPGLAFDERGGRIGYGKGFYDRALADADMSRVVGVCYDEQVIDDVPMESFDTRVPRLCTPSRGVFSTRI